MAASRVNFVSSLSQNCERTISFVSNSENKLQKQTIFECLYVNAALYLTRDFQWLENLERDARILKMTQELRSRQLLKFENVSLACIRLARER
jgi:hypothetical protein